MKCRSCDDDSGPVFDTCDSCMVIEYACLNGPGCDESMSSVDGTCAHRSADAPVERAY